MQVIFSRPSEDQRLSVARDEGRTVAARRGADALRRLRGPVEPAVLTAAEPPRDDPVAGVLDPSWRTAGYRPEPPPDGGTVMTLGTMASVEELRARDERRAGARCIEERAWTEEVGDADDAVEAARQREKTASSERDRPVGVAEALLHARSRVVLGAGMAAVAAVSGVVRLLPRPRVEPDDTSRSWGWLAAAVGLGVTTLGMVAHQAGVEGVLADRQGAVDRAVAATQAARRERRTTMRGHAAWMAGG